MTLCIEEIHKFLVSCVVMDGQGQSQYLGVFPSLLRPESSTLVTRFARDLDLKPNIRFWLRVNAPLSTIVVRTSVCSLSAGPAIIQRIMVYSSTGTSSRVLVTIMELDVFIVLVNCSIRWRRSLADWYRFFMLSVSYAVLIAIWSMSTSQASGQYKTSHVSLSD